MRSSLDRLVLVLNASYEPLHICAARHALTLVFKGAAVVEVVSRHTVKTPRLTIPVPDVIRLVRYRRVPRQKHSVSRKGILLRDGLTCQYCGGKFQAGDLTLDHVIPRSRGGESSWANLAAACFRCNNKKGSRTPEEAGMPLARPPRQVSIHAKHRMMASDQNAWDRFLFA